MFKVIFNYLLIKNMFDSKTLSANLTLEKSNLRYSYKFESKHAYNMSMHLGWMHKQINKMNNNSHK